MHRLLSRAALVIGLVLVAPAAGRAEEAGDCPAPFTGVVVVWLDDDSCRHSFRYAGLDLPRDCDPERLEATVAGLSERLGVELRLREARGLPLAELVATPRALRQLSRSEGVAYLYAEEPSTWTTAGGRPGKRSSPVDLSWTPAGGWHWGRTSRHDTLRLYRTHGEGYLSPECEAWWKERAPGE